MIPNKDVTPQHLTIQNRKGKLIAVSGVSEEQQAVERHIQPPKVGGASKCLIVGADTRHGLKEPEPIFTRNAIGFAEKFDELHREPNVELPFCTGDGCRVSSR